MACCSGRSALFVAWLSAFASLAVAEDADRLLVDVGEMDGVRVSNSGASSNRENRAGHTVLRVSTEAGHAYPGVRFANSAGAWDMSGFDGASVEVTNTADTPIRVLLSLNNPGADGRNHCNVSGVGLAAGETQRLIAPFGVWHSETNRPLDRSNIVELVVFLDRPKAATSFEIGNVTGVTIDEPDLDVLMADPFFAAVDPPFGRGVNLGNALDAPSEGEWGITLTDEDFRVIAEAGFDSVRLPVRWSAHAEVDAPYAIDEEFFRRVDHLLEQARTHGLGVVLNVHHYGELMAEPAAHGDRFVALWRQIASRYRDAADSVAFELLNEPQGALTAGVWNGLLVRALAAVRETNPTRWVVIGPAQFNSIGQLSRLELPADDRRIVATVHYYSPHHFTHQGAEWSGPEAQEWLGTSWTGTPAERAAVVRDFDRALAWSIEQKRPLYLGEFGAYSKADLDSRVRWTAYVADQATRRKFGLGYWEFRSGFGLYNARSGEWIVQLRDAVLGE